MKEEKKRNVGKKEKICILTHYFPPLQHITKRPYFLAYHLSEMGYDVSVITTKKNIFHGFIDKTIAYNVNFKIIEIPHQPLEIIYYFVELLRGLRGDNNKGIGIRELRLLFRLKELRDFFLKLFGPNFDILYSWIPGALFYMIRKMIAKEDKYDVIISTFPPPSVHIIASVIKFLFPSVKWIADYRDAWYHIVLTDFKLPGVTEFLKLLERVIVSRADHVVAVSDHIVKILSENLGREVSLIRNSFGEKESLRLKKIQQRRKKAGFGKKIFLYTGAFYHGYKVENLFKGISMLKSRYHNLGELMKVEIYGVDNVRINDIVKENNISDIVEYKGIVENDLILKIQQEADFLLFFNYSDSIGGIEKGIITGKLYEYITSGTPIISIGKYEDSEANLIIKETGTGIFVENKPEKIAELIERIIIKKQDILFSPNIEKIMDFSSIKMVEKFADLIIA